MSTSLTPDQINQLSSLGISVPNTSSTNTPSNTSNLSLGQIPLQTNTSTHPPTLLPLLSISGLTVISIGGLILFKNKTDISISPQTPLPIRSPQSEGRPTQVPKSIQHYLLASQQYFSQALQAQNPMIDDQQSTVVDLINQSILAANSAIQQFPQDYRGYYQRSRIYQSVLNSQPQLLPQAIHDLSTASQLNPSSADITRELANLFAKSGDTNNTLTYLAQTVVLEPTKAQNFYDLAKLQQQLGFLPAALDTYNKLIPLITDISQRQQVETEVDSLQKLITQIPSISTSPSPTPGWSPASAGDNNPAPLIQASTESRIIIAAPETRTDIQVKDQTDSNALSGTLTLPANQTSITLRNSNINSTSNLYLTITYGGKNQNLQVLSKTTGSATIGLPSPISEDIQFKWWIINP